jgi:hypothetical protein
MFHVLVGCYFVEQSEMDRAAVDAKPAASLSVSESQKVRNHSSGQVALGF